MKGGVAYYLVGAGVLLALAGCGRGIFTGERAPWRHQAEVECMKSGAVKLGAGVVRMEPIEGPGMCGADFPLKVAALGESAAAIGYGDDLRPPGSIPNASQMPNWPINEPRYAPPAPIDRVDVQPTSSQAGQPRMRWVPGPPPAERAAPMGSAGQPIELRPAGITPSVTPNAARPDDIPDDAVLPDRIYPPQRAQPAPVYQQPQQTAPVYRESPRSVPALGPARAPRMAAATPATLTPAATLACPIVSALDHWVSDGVQPAAMRWFGAQVVEIKQISSYSCRGMVGAGGSGISEHAFGNAIDIAAFTFADGRRVTVQEGWRGTPEEQGFLRDVHLAACDNFSTVLAPGYNAAHYNHIHVDLMRRANGDRPCRPEAMTGEMAAAKARALYAKHRGPAYTSSVPQASRARTAVPGEDGFILDLENLGDVTGATYRSKRGIEQHSAK
jgi:hypothetical protein